MADKITESLWIPIAHKLGLDINQLIGMKIVRRETGETVIEATFIGPTETIDNVLRRSFQVLDDYTIVERDHA